MPTTPTLLSRILIIAILVLASANPTPAQSSPISVRITAGTVFLSLRDWERFFTDIADHEYQHHVPDPYVGASVHLALSDRHAISVGTERIRTSGSLFGYMVIINQTGDSLGILAVDIVNWTFQGIPITLGYEYRRPLWNGRIIPFAGAGLSYFMSQVQADITYMAQAMPMPEADSSPRKG
ncbi:MAG: hypothetical protein IID13_09360 [Candidatus Marinimicrobia bacterium]|nr:hypothetical protein [Candidatus Neomarinimicrobiota bacterium]